MQTVIMAAAISVTASIITSVFVTVLGCCSFRFYMEKEWNRVGEEMIELVKESIRDAYRNK